MNVSVLRRLTAACAILTAAALVAVGCGGSGSGSSGAADAAKDAKGLDFVPQDAIMYMTFDTDLDGDNWKNVDKLAPAFYEDVKPVQEYLEEESKEDGKDGVDYEEDVKPWLGDTAGVAVTAVATEGDSKGEPEAFAWLDVTDREAFEEFAKDQDMEKDGSAGDFDIWHEEGDDDSFVAVSDEIALFGDSKESVSERAEFDGDSIKDADELGDVVDNVEGDALMALVVSGQGVRDALEASDDESAAKAADNKELQKLEGVSMTISAEDDGFHVRGFIGTDGLDEELLGTNASTDFAKDLPGDTIVALGGHDLGGTIQKVLDIAGDADPEIADAVGSLNGVIGVSPKDLAEAFKDEWALSLSGSDEDLTKAKDGAMGSMMGGNFLSSLGSIDATLAFAANGETEDTMEKLFGATQMATGTPPKEGKSGDFDTLTSNFGGMSVIAASTEDLALITTSTAALEGWGEGDTLGDNDAFKEAWEAADAPDEVSGLFFLDWPRVAGIAEIPTSEKAEAGGWVAWSETDGDDATFDLFMHAEEK